VERRASVAGTNALLAAPLAVEVRQAGKVYRIGMGDKASDANGTLVWRTSGPVCGREAGTRA
jgi:hypothetical protein